MSPARKRSASLSLTLAAAGGTFLSLLWFKYCPVPFAGPLVMGAVFCLLGLIWVRGQVAQSVLVTLATIGLTLAGAEAYWWYRFHSGPPNLDYPENYLRPDPVVGYAPARNASIQVRREFHDTLMYDVRYSIDSLGLRVSPPPADPPPTECVLVFGDSYAFGEGVADTESMPYRVAVRSGGRYHVLNFGVHGYGPHQMLALLESGRVSRDLDCRPRYAIYVSILDHVARAAGRRPGGRGPRYALDPNHVLQRMPRNIGDEDTGELTLGAYLQSQFEKSSLVNLARTRVKQEDWDLFYAIVTRAARIVRDSFPGSCFHVIAWEEGTGTPLAEGLRRQGLRVHEVGEIIPGYRADPRSYRIPIDGHPNARAQDLVAAYVVDSILGSRPPAPVP